MQSKGINANETAYFKIFDAVIHDNRLSEDEVCEISMNLIQAFTWVIPTQKALDVFDKHSHVVELGAGRGYWARHYSKKAIEVHCYDLYPQYNTFHPVRTGGPHSLQDYVEPWTLFICSPQYRSDMVLEGLRYFGGDHFIYAGDTNFGLNLPSIVKTLKDEWTQEDEILLPNWPNSNNKMLVFKRRE